MGFCWVEDSLGQVAGGLRALNRPDFSESFNAQEFTLTIAHEMEGLYGNSPYEGIGLLMIMCFIDGKEMSSYYNKLRIT